MIDASDKRTEAMIAASQLGGNNFATISVCFTAKENRGAFGYKAQTLVFEGLMHAGVIEPTKVARIGLENSSSRAGLELTIECIHVEKTEK